VTSDPLSRSDSVRRAISDVARALPSDDPRSHVFFEDRVDRRVALRSSGYRDAVATRTRGAAIVGRKSSHASDPEFMEAARGPAGLERAHEDWTPGIEDLIVRAGAGVSAGRRESSWSAKLV
jgi:hypothetical protein